MMKPQISVIMPVYNAEKYVGAAIKSVLGQTFGDFELIIINDGSTDYSEATIVSFKDKRIVYLKQSNQGQVIASNNGIKMAQGDYIKFLDADDLMNPKHLELQYKALEGSRSQLSSCQWAVFYDNHLNIRFKKEHTNKDYRNSINWFYDAHHYDSGMLSAWLWLIPRDVLDKAGYWNETLSLNNDFDFSVRLLIASKGVKYVDGAKLYYRTGSQNSLTHTKSRKSYESALLSTELAMGLILEVENSDRMKTLFADRFQSWIYQIYPQYPDITNRMNNNVASLGGSNIKPHGGKVFRVLNTLLPWKMVMRLQLLMHKTIWKPILNWKYKMKINKKFAN
jgi:glycosyltransferase involved in cell wall biosynthesis